MACRRIVIAYLLLVFTAQGCTADVAGNRRFRLEALESRCGVRTVKQLTALPPLSLESRGDDANDTSATTVLSPVALRLIKLLGLEVPLHDLSALQRDRAGKSAAVLWRHQQIMDRISLASFDVISTVTELDCEEARADHVADGLTEVRQDKQERGLFLALVGDALIGVVAGALSLAGKATAASANAILGGALATGLGGAATIFLAADHEFSHSRNHLGELWEAHDSSPLFPDSVWQYLTAPRGPSEETIRDKLIARWRHEGRFGDPASEATGRRTALLLGEGGIYSIRDLRIRAEMLNHLKSTVLQMGQDLNVLMYEIMAAAPYSAMAEAGR